MRWDSVIIGAGCAGLAAATALAESGCRVLVLERRKILGGRASSFIDRETGETIDNGQHLFLGCYWETRKYLNRIGSAHDLIFQQAFETTLFGPDGSSAGLRTWKVRPPYHFVGAILRYRALSILDRLKTLRVGREVERSFHGLEHLSVDQWLTRLGQTKRARSRFWDLLTLATLNADPTQVPANLLATVFRDGFMASAEASKAGISAVGLSDLLGEPAEKYLSGKQGLIRRDAAVRGIVCGDSGEVVGVELADGEFVQARTVISAVPPNRLRELVGDAPNLANQVGPARRLVRSSIVSLHAWLEADPFEEKFVGLWDRQFHWIFRKSKIFKDISKGSHYSFVISAADKVLDTPKEQLISKAETELNESVSRLKGRIKIKRAIVVRERDATWFPPVGESAARLGTFSGAENFFLAGDWTNTGLPATIESAVLSGHKAADAVATVLRLRSTADAGYEFKKTEAVSAQSATVERTSTSLKVGDQRPAPKQVVADFQKSREDVMTDFEKVYREIRSHVEFDDDRVLLRDPKRFRDQYLDQTANLILSHERPEIRKAFQWLIRSVALSNGIIPSTLHSIYSDRSGKGFDRMTIPSFSVPRMIYPVSRSIIRTARDLNVKAMVFDVPYTVLAKREITVEAYTSTVLAAALKEAFAGPVFFQLSDFAFDKEEFAKNQEAEIFKLKTVLSSAVIAGVYNIKLSLSSLLPTEDDIMFSDQRKAIEQACGELVRHTRSIEPEPFSVCWQINLATQRGSNTTMEPVKTFLDGVTSYLSESTKSPQSISKIGIQFDLHSKLKGVSLTPTAPDSEEPMVNLRKLFQDLRDLNEFCLSSFKLSPSLVSDVNDLPLPVLERLPEFNVAEAPVSGLIDSELKQVSGLPTELLSSGLNSVAEVKALDTMEDRILVSVDERLHLSFSQVFRSLKVLNSLDSVLDAVPLDKVAPMVDDSVKRLFFS